MGRTVAIFAFIICFILLFAAPAIMADPLDVSGDGRLDAYDGHLINRFIQGARSPDLCAAVPAGSISGGCPLVQHRIGSLRGPCPTRPSGPANCACPTGEMRSLLVRKDGQIIIYLKPRD